ncbi:MAG TPA: glycosyltransferase family 4 protein [Aestuariivirgaceae bacterium]|nr:glycosyltransferase family 4 protein [Aestuariivirgaceae bacterium]
MKLIFVNRYFDPDRSATSQVLSDLAFHLATRDHDVHVVASRQLYDDPGAILPATETIRGVSVHRVPTSRFGRKSLAGRTIDYASFHASAAARLVRLARPNDIIIAKTDPPLVSVTAAGAARIRGARLVNWVQDLFPEVAERLGVLTQDGAGAGALRRVRDIALRQASTNVAIGTGMARRLENVGSGKVRTIGNWTNDDAVRPVPAAQNRLRRDWDLEGRFIVGYSGNLGRAHECETLLGAAERLRGQSDIVFLFVGGGHHTAALKAAFAARKLASLRVRPYQPHAGLGTVLALPDVHWVSLRPELEGLIVPSKFYGICAAGRPVIMVGDTEGEIGSIVEDAGCGMAVARGDDAGFASAILRLRNDGALRDAMGGRARRLLDDRFSRSNALRLWQDLIGELSPPS